VTLPNTSLESWELKKASSSLASDQQRLLLAFHVFGPDTDRNVAGKAYPEREGLWRRSSELAADGYIAHPVIGYTEDDEEIVATTVNNHSGRSGKVWEITEKGYLFLCELGLA
jgi:hypothetical protein